MFTQTASVTFKLLLFRAGPEDLPYSRELTRLLLPLAALANFCIFSQVLPRAMAGAMAVAMVIGMALSTQTLLGLRKLPQRFNQTFNALLATGALLTLALTLPFAQVAPVLMQAAQNPQLLQHPEQLTLPQAPVLLMNLLNFWNLAVSAHILRGAMNVNFGIGILLALVAAFAALIIAVFIGSLTGSLFA